MTSCSPGSSGEAPPIALSAWAKVEKEPHSPAKKAWQANALQFFVTGRTRRQVSRMGFKGASARTFKAARKLASVGGGRFEYPPSRAGRGKCPTRTIEKAYVAAAHPTSKVAASGAKILALRGPKAAVVRRLVCAGVCKKSTAYRRAPHFVTKARRSTDLCSECEALYDLRHTACAWWKDLASRNAGLATNRFPAPVPPLVDGQRAIAREGARAIEMLREAAALQANGSCLIKESGVAAAVRRFVDACDSLAFHERVAEKQRASFLAEKEAASKSLGSTCVLRFDFAGVVALRPRRETNQQWRTAPRVSILTVAFWPPRTGRSPYYVDVISDCLDRTARHAVSQVILAIGEAEKAGMLLGAENTSAWSDCGTHFRAAEFIYHFLRRSQVPGGGAAINFDGEHHGKGVCDGRFAVVKSYLRQYAMAQAGCWEWDSEEPAAKTAAKAVNAMMAGRATGGQRARGAAAQYCPEVSGVNEVAVPGVASVASSHCFRATNRGGRRIFTSCVLSENRAGQEINLGPMRTPSAKERNAEDPPRRTLKRTLRREAIDESAKKVAKKRRSMSQSLAKLPDAWRPGGGGPVPP